MKRAPRTATRGQFRGEPADPPADPPRRAGQDDGREYVFHDAVGKVAITYSPDDPAAPAYSSGDTTISAAPVSTCSSSST